MLQQKTDYSIPVYPNGMTPSNPNCPRIYFPNAATKDQYVAKERAFCARAYTDFLDADNKHDREEKKKLFYKRRTFFAQQSGYAPSMKDHKMWFYKATQGKTNA